MPSKRLLEREARVAAIRRNRRSTENRSALAENRNRAEALTEWRAGRVIPWRITMFLDAGGHYGPEVDEACGVEEPTVDLWEAGELYPTWEQLEALARLCETSPIVFTGALSGGAKWKNPPWWPAHFGTKVPTVEDEPIIRFTPAALAVHRTRLAAIPEENTDA